MRERVLHKTTNHLSILYIFCSIICYNKIPYNNAGCRNQLFILFVYFIAIWSILIIAKEWRRNKLVYSDWFAATKWANKCVWKNQWNKHENKRMSDNGEQDINTSFLTYHYHRLPNDPSQKFWPSVMVFFCSSVQRGIQSNW